MKDVARLLIYGTVSLAVIWLLVELAGREAVSGYELLPLALLLVVVVPLVLGVVMARRERARSASAGGERPKGQDAGKP
jgi:hypothetical protein